jgi:uncharacterized protein YegP (UPF0339 family)
MRQTARQMKRGKVMRRNTFEIFPADEGRFAWRLVAGDREVARSTRTYRSHKRVLKAIRAARRADVVELAFSAQNGPFVLRPSEFELVEDVNQLLVGDILRRRRRRREPRNAALQAEAKQEADVAGELRAEAQAETAVAGELRVEAATEAVVGVAADAEELVEAAVAKAGVADALEADADALEADAQTLEADAKAKAAQAKPARRGRGTRG